MIWKPPKRQKPELVREFLARRGALKAFSEASLQARRGPDERLWEAPRGPGARHLPRAIFMGFREIIYKA